VSRVRLALMFAVCFAVFLAANAPFSVAVGMLRGGADEFRFQRVEGRIWRGRIVGAALQGHPLGDIETQLDPLGLLTGAVKVKWAFRGQGLDGEGVYIRRIASAAVLKDATVRADLRRLAFAGLARQPLQGALEVTIDRARFDADGCRALKAQVWTDALMHSSGELGWSGPALAGEATCEDRRLIAPLEGERDGERIAITAALDPNLSYRLDGAVTTDDPELRIVLPFLGFQEEDGVYGFTQEGVLRPPEPVS